MDDATLLAKTLGSLDPPFEVTLLTDAGQRETEDAVEIFVDKARDAECALVYFAGHGVEYHGENFLLVRDTAVDRISADVARMKRRLANDALSLQMLVDELDATRAQVKVVILDACRNNPLQAEESSGTRSLVGGSRGLAQVTPPSGSLIAYSADAGQRANDGLFTGVLAEQLQRPGLPLLQVFAATREEVLARSTEMAATGMGVRHEPAEYTKLNLAGTKFAFTAGERNTPKAESDQIVAMRAQIEELKRTVEFLREQGAGNGTLEAQVEKMEEALAAASNETPESADPLASGGPMPSTPDDEVEALGEHLNQILAVLAMTERKLEDASTADTREQLEEKLAELRLERRTLETRLSEMTGQGSRMRTEPTTTGAFSTSRGMEGSRAGEVREFGGIEMVWCPPGTFRMGNPGGDDERNRDETPHEVTLTQGFWMAKTECTQQQWELGMGTDVGEQKEKSSGFGKLRGFGSAYPMYFVNWDDACEWMRQMNRNHPLPDGWEWTLPTEAQWEYACRAGSKGAYAGNLDDVAWFDENSGSRIQTVGQKIPNDWGMYDMLGNVREWCADWFGEYPGEALTDPEGAANGSYRVSRGGSWDTAGSACGSASRGAEAPSIRSDYTGFRPAISRTN